MLLHAWADMQSVSASGEVPVCLLPQTGKGCVIRDMQAVTQGNFCGSGSAAAAQPSSSGSPAMPPPPPPGRRTAEVDDLDDPEDDDDYEEPDHSHHDDDDVDGDHGES